MRSNSCELRILLVDDHESTLAVLKRLLRLEGHAVKATTASQYALEMARTESFDLVMTDIGLPDMDGCELLAELRAIRPIKAIALTGHGLPDEVSEIQKAGFDEILVKPIDFDALMQTVGRVAATDEETLHPTPPPIPKRHAPDANLLLTTLCNYERTLSMLTSQAERSKLEWRISHLRGKLRQLGFQEQT